MHVSLYVSDIDKTVEFYQAFFDQKATKIEEGYAKFILDSPSLIISFVKKPERIQQSFGHLGFQVQELDQMKASLERMKRHQMPIREEMGTSCCYALQDKFWVQDPDGYQWEVYYFHEDVEFNDPHYELKSSKSEATEKTKVAMAELGGASCAPGSGCC